jgi:hypothetical protein
MRFLSAIIATTLLSWSASVFAQEPPLPAATETPAASASVRPQLNIPEIPLSVEPSPLVPSDSPAPKKSAPPIADLDAAFQHSSLGQAAEEYRLHIEWRQLQNRSAHDPEVMAAKAAAAAARTDLDKRTLLRAYYKLWYAHMEALAATPDVKAYLERMKKGALDGLAQPHVRPEPTPQPSATP